MTAVVGEADAAEAAFLMPPVVAGATALAVAAASEVAADLAAAEASAVTGDSGRWQQGQVVAVAVALSLAVVVSVLDGGWHPQQLVAALAAVVAVTAVSSLSNARSGGRQPWQRWR